MIRCYKRNAQCYYSFNAICKFDKSNDAFYDETNWIVSPEIYGQYLKLSDSVDDLKVLLFHFLVFLQKFFEKFEANI